MPARLITVLAAALTLAVPATATAAQKRPCRGFCERPATALTAETKTVTAGDITVGYRTFGTGRTLVLIPGLGQGMDQWDPELLDGLARRHRLVVFDPQGIGRTTETEGELTVQGLMADTARLITALKLQRPDILGHSLGGMVAQELALRRPDLVRRVVLAATSPGTPRSTPPTAKALTLATDPETTVRQRQLGLLFPPQRTTAPTSYYARLLQRPSLSVAPVSVMARHLAAMNAYLADPQAALPRLGRLAGRVRVLVAGGAKDIVLPPANARLIKQALPGAQLVVYANGGHGFPYQERLKFGPRVLDFLR